MFLKNISRKNMQKGVPQPFYRVTALLLPQEGCRDLIKVLLLLLWNTGCLLTGYAASVGEEWGCSEGGHHIPVMLLSWCYRPALPACSLDPERSRVSTGAPLGPFCLPTQIWLVAKIRKLVFRPIGNLTLWYAACWRWNMMRRKCQHLCFVDNLDISIWHKGKVPCEQDW